MTPDRLLDVQTMLNTAWHAASRDEKDRLIRRAMDAIRPHLAPANPREDWRCIRDGAVCSVECTVNALAGRCGRDEP